MPWTRWTGWSSKEEHFRYDARLRRYIPDSGQSSAEPAPFAVATYLDALAEIRRAMLREPATEWETGLLIRLYAETTGLQAESARDASMSVTGRGQSRWPGRWDVVLRRIVEVSEAVIGRVYPDQVTELARLADLAAATGLNEDEPRLPDPAGHLNAVADQIVLKDGAAMRAIWLASFSRPASWGRGDELSSGLRNKDFISACADLARVILADAGPTASSLTTELASTIVSDQGTSS